MSLIRTALVVLALYILWKACSRLLLYLGKVPGHGNRTVHPGQGRPVDELVQDPVCRLYIPRREAVVHRGRDADSYFCSEKCRDIYAARNDGRQG